MRIVADIRKLFDDARTILSQPNRRQNVDTWIRVITFTAPAMFLAIILIQPWVEPEWMFLDTLTAARSSENCCGAAYGFISNLGIMIWTAAAAVCLFAAAVFAQANARALMWFALSAGLLNGLLALDDAFLLHEDVLPRFGVPQNLVLATYIALGLAYAAASWRIILAADYVILFVAGAAIVVSLLIDIVFSSHLPNHIYIEDSAKFFGIFSWASFHITTLFFLLTDTLKPPIRRE